MFAEGFAPIALLLLAHPFFGGTYLPSRAGPLSFSIIIQSTIFLNTVSLNVLMLFYGPPSSTSKRFRDE